MTTADTTVPTTVSVPRPNVRRGLMLAARAGFTFAVGIVLVVALLLVTGGAGFGLFLRGAAALPVGVDVPDEVELGTLDERSVVYARDGSMLAELHDEYDRRHVSLEEIPDHVVYAVLAAEDRRFYEHDGYDPAAIGRALIANLRAQGVEQGGSTITQQLAKQNFVGDERTLQRKLDELAFAMALERDYTKDELVERYLNQIYFGNRAYGIATAAWEYFRAEPAELSAGEAALLASVIRAPGALNPRENLDAVVTRRDQVLAGMVEEGWLERSEAETALAVQPQLAPTLEREHSEPYVIEAVKRAFFDDERFGDTRQERIDRLFTGGLAIHTTLSPRLQAIAGDVVDAHTAELDGPTAALAAVHPQTGEMLAVYGGADFEAEQFDLATQGRRQPGSALKPFVLAAALENGVPLSLQLEGDTGAEFDVPGWTEDDDGVRNFGDSSFGRIDPREALVRSVNTAFAELIIAVGVDETVGLLDRVGIDTARALGSHDGPAVALGGVGNGVTPLEMASAYAVFANAGQRVEPHLIERVVDRAGNEVFVRTPDPQQIIDPRANAAMVDIMRDVVAHGTGTRAQLPDWDVAGKTGTSQNSYDAWFAGMTAPLATAVWVGHAEGQIEMPGMTGGGVPAQMWHDFMAAALDGQDPKPFPDADVDFSDLSEGEPVDVPDVRGLDVDEAEQELTEARLVAVQREVASQAPRGQVVWQSPGPDSTAPAGSDVAIGVSTGQAPPDEPDDDDEALEQDPETDTPGVAEDEDTDDP